MASHRAKSTLTSTISRNSFLACMGQPRAYETCAPISS
ncbi:hypothetical protein SNL152K_10773 [Streptomyces sp. NL15-2K]|nr:hypothetical protein SNL152K_10773 [Streptomyces sp. NL15-2K]